MSAVGISEQLVLRGTSDENVPSILAQFRKCVELKGGLHVPFEEANTRAVRFFPLLLKNVALDTYIQLVLGTLEWRLENILAELRIRQVDVILVAPQIWSDWEEPMTAMFAPPNLLSNLCREFATVRQGGKEHLGVRSIYSSYLQSFHPTVS